MGFEFSRDLSCQYLLIDALAFPVLDEDSQWREGEAFFEDIISIRIAIGSGVAFFIAQNLDVQIFDRLRRKSWYVAPLTSSTIGSITDTFLFFSIAFYASGVPWITLALGDLIVKLIITLGMLIPFRLLLYKIKDHTQNLGSKAKL